MPELPEVESLRRMLARSIIGRKIISAEVVERRLRRTVSRALPSKIAEHKIRGLRRRAKYLIIDLSGGLSLLVHLGMSGSLTVRSPRFSNSQLDKRHDHAQLVLDNGTILVYNDPRRFGLLKILSSTELETAGELRALGPEPLSDDFDAAYLSRIAKGRKAAVKNFLMDQRIVAGIGNIYASEILFRAGVRPSRRAGRVSRAEMEKIVDATKVILNQAIDSRGTTFRSYLDSRGEPGAFASRLMVYGRAGEPCYTCSAPIRDRQLGQRSSYYCQSCQR